MLYCKIALKNSEHSEYIWYMILENYNQMQKLCCCVATCNVKLDKMPKKYDFENSMLTIIVISFTK